jgi:hypothetical protein
MEAMTMMTSELLTNAAQSLINKIRARESGSPLIFAERLIVADKWQKSVLLSDAKQIILNCSRQTGKSTITAFLAAHTAIFTPESLVLLVCPSERQSGELLRKIKDILANTPGIDFSRDAILQVELGNGSRILALPSAEANLRGFSAPAMVCIDEASRCDDALFYSLKPLMAIGRGKMILLSSPFGRRGFFYNVWENGENWKRFTVKATDCPRISKEFLDAEKNSMPEFIFRQEYLCEFIDNETQIFPSELIENSINPSLKAFAW